MRLILATTVLLTLAGCGNSDDTYHPPEYHPPKFEEPKIDTSKLRIDPAIFSKLEEMKTCNKPPKESDLTPEVKAKPLGVHETIEVQDVEKVDCDGKKTLEPKKAQNEFKPMLRIDPPTTLSVNAASASVENLTTCVKRTVNHSAAMKNLNKEDELRRKIMWIMDPAAIDAHNVIAIELSDSNLKMASNGLNVVKGQNLIKVTYKNQDGDEISHKQVLVNVEIDQRDLQGVKTIDNCKQ